MFFTKLCGIVLVACTLVVAQGAIAQVILRPVDQAASQPEFFTFRAHLQIAIARRDAAAVLTIVHKEIKNSFGGDDGIEGFKQKWKLESGNSDLWKELGRVLSLGGSFDRDGRFIAPYVFSRWPEKMDSFENVAIIGANVRVREAPRNDSATVGSLSFVVVPLLPRAKRTRGLDRNPSTQRQDRICVVAIRTQSDRLPSHIQTYRQSVAAHGFSGG